jgi:hypothetical protein
MTYGWDGHIARVYADNVKNAGNPTKDFCYGCNWIYVTEWKLPSGVQTKRNTVRVTTKYKMAKLSSAELAKREDVIQKMKKNKRSLVKRYGPDAEKVMYGRATNIAKKVAETQMEKSNLKELVRAALMKKKQASLKNTMTILL